MKPKILHIGVGFLGNNVIRLLKEKGYEVEIYSRSFGQDITDKEKLEEAIKRNDYIIQNAAIADLNDYEAKPLLGSNVNIWGTVLCANYATKHKKRLYNISTCCVYGDSEDYPSTEESKTIPSELYANAKLAGEYIIKGYHKSFGLEYNILRVATLYGPEMRSSLAPAIFLGQILSGEEVTVHGDGMQTRTLTYVDDVAEGIVSTIEHSNVVNETINISSEEELSVMDWIVAISKVVGLTAYIKHIEDRVGQTHKERIDASKAKRLLGWEAKVSFKEGIERTFAWMQQIWKEEQNGN